MPVVLGENLTLEENKLSAVYKELYTKLNKAYAWTNIQTTSSGGSAVILCNGSIIDALESNGNIDFGTMTNWCGYSVIIDGKIYVLKNGDFKRIGEGNNFQKLICGYNNTSFFNDNNDIYSLNRDSDNYDINVENSGSIDKFSGNGQWGAYIIYIKDGKIYDYTKTNALSNFNNCYDAALSSFDNSGYLEHNGFVINDGFLYRVENNSSISLLSNNNNWVKFIYFYLDYYNVNVCYVINSDNEIYIYNNGNSIEKIQIPEPFNKIKKFYPYVFLTTDGKIYVRYYNNLNICKNITNNHVWTDISDFYNYGDNYYGYGISDSKLYFISYSYNNDEITFTQLGTESGYTKIDGNCYITNSISDNNICAIAYTGESTTISNTVYTTKKPIISDNAYFNVNNFNNHSVISNVTNNTITDQYRTYTRDPSKDSHFKDIPVETSHEKVSVIDILAATNPND